jgi:S-adenosyl-L-methionine hydrolase (adenosine-forming)
MRNADSKDTMFESIQFSENSAFRTPRSAFITLLTDFGTRDYFVPAVKGVIYTINPQVQVVDISHEVAAQAIASAAFILAACYQNFPKGTIHLAVVDPGVGSLRRAIVVEAGSYLFVGPDNGIFSYVYDRESRVRAFQITRDQFFRPDASRTFQGRDLFAPVAAWLSRGLSPGALGDEIDDYLRLEIPRPKLGEEKVEGRIIHIDRFGNCLTNLTAADLQSVTRIEFAGREITRIYSHFAESAGTRDLFAYIGSAGYWEIAIWCGSAAELTGARVGMEIVFEFGV